MSVTNLNKISGLAPEKEMLEEHQGPPKTLEEIINISKAIKLSLWEIERYVEQSSPTPPPAPSSSSSPAPNKKKEGGIGVTKQQLEAHLMRTKGDMVRLQRMLQEELLAEHDVGGGDEEGFDI